MTLMTYPPDFLVGPRGNIFSGQASVFRRVPLFGKNRINGLEAVVFTNDFPRTVWTPSPSSSVTEGSFPFVTFATYPPDLPVRPRLTSLAVKLPFFVGCRSLARVGYVKSRL